MSHTPPRGWAETVKVSDPSYYLKSTLFGVQYLCKECRKKPSREGQRTHKESCSHHFINVRKRIVQTYKRRHAAK